MSQCVDFAVLPGVPAPALPAAIRELFSFISRETPTPRTLRAHLRGRDWFDAEGFPVLSDFLGLGEWEASGLGPFGRAVVEAGDDADVRDAVSRRLVDANPLLVKYCLEALDVDRGGRLHSTNELYRMITSYVYPGTRPTLVSFKAWIDWAAAAGLIRIVGIRWALGSGATAVLPELRAIDPEEFLDDERAASEMSPAPVAPTATPLAVAPSATTPSPTDAPAIPPVKVRSKARPPAPAPTVDPAAPPEPPAADDRDPATVLIERYADLPAVDGFCPDTLHIDLSQDNARSRLELAFGALLLGRGLPLTVAGRVMGALRDRGAIDEAAAGRIPTEAIAAMVAADPDPAVGAVCETLVHLPRLASGPSKGGWPDDPRAFLDLAWQRLFAPADPLAPFVLARLLWSTGRLAPQAAPAAFVPVFAARASAFRLGISDSLYAGSFCDLADLALSLAARFGPPTFELPLVRLAADLGCTFGCSRANACPLPCREKVDVAPPSRWGLL